LILARTITRVWTRLCCSISRHALKTPLKPRGPAEGHYRSALLYNQESNEGKEVLNEEIDVGWPREAAPCSTRPLAQPCEAHYRGTKATGNREAQAVTFASEEDIFGRTIGRASEDKSGAYSCIVCIFLYAHLLSLVSTGYAPDQVQLRVSFWNTVDLKEFMGVFIY
jgi:hypothetical protein